MMRSICLAIAMLLAGTAVAAAQSSRKGRVLIDEDFSSGVVDTKNFSNDSWDVPETWQLRDGTVAAIYDPTQHPGRAHGKSINPKFEA